MSGLGISITNSPLSKPSDKNNFDLNQDIIIDEWDELFLNVLKVPEITPSKQESRINFLNRRETLFQEILTSKGYKLIGRICHFSQDAFYFNSEVETLLKECIDIQKKTQNSLALSGLNKLILACNKALSVNSGIWLVSD